MAQTTREGHLITQELQALPIGPVEVTVHLLGGQVIEGHSEVVAISRRGFPMQTSGPDSAETWVPLANLKYIVLGGDFEPDPGESETERKALLSFRDGDTIQAYLAGMPGSTQEGFPVRMRVPDTEFVSPVLCCSQSLLEIRFVDRWGVGLTQWTAAPRRRRTDRTPILGGGAKDDRQGGSRVTQLAAHYRDRLSLIRDSDLSSGDQESFTRSVRLHIDNMLDDDQLTLTMSERTELIDQILLQAVGYGPLDSLLHDRAGVARSWSTAPTTSSSSGDGMLMKAEARFQDEGQLLETIRRMVATTGRHIDG